MVYTIEGRGGGGVGLGGVFMQPWYVNPGAYKTCHWNPPTSDAISPDAIAPARCTAGVGVPSSDAGSVPGTELRLGCGDHSTHGDARRLRWTGDTTA
jgi:hypothetical protein